MISVLGVNFVVGMANGNITSAKYMGAMSVPITLNLKSRIILNKNKRKGVNLYMSCFICEKCGAIENTATSQYWVREMNGEQLLCSECDPDIGKWHNKFEKKIWSECYPAETFIEFEDDKKGNCINARRYFELYKERLEYNGYYTIVKYSIEDNVFYGKIEALQDLVNFESTDYYKIKKEFESAVDDYLKFCKEVGKEPEEKTNETIL